MYQYLSDHQEEKGTNPVERNLHVPSHDTHVPPDDTVDLPGSSKAVPLTEYGQNKRSKDDDHSESITRTSDLPQQHSNEPEVILIYYKTI